MLFPAADVVEISVLGKGHGESTVVHVGDGEWIVIDSLTDESGRSAPLVYLEELGVDVSTQVKLVVATHWHDDHIDGISELYDAAKSATFAMPLPIAVDKFVEFVDSYFDSDADAIAELSEIARIGHILSTPGRPAPVHTKAGTPLFTGHMSHGKKIRLEALSPSDREVQHFMLSLKAPSGVPKRGKGRLLPFRENDVSIASWLDIEVDHAMFGADLEAKLDSDRGWNAVVSSPHRPSGKASLYKVSHHGSKTGDQDNIWTDLLVEHCVCVVAPYGLGRGLPRLSDKNRLLSRSKNVYVTAITPSRKYRDTGASEERRLSDFNINIKSLPQKVGAIRSRRSVHQSEWSVERLQGAQFMKDFVPKG